MTEYDAAQWSDFALAQLGASAALLGLVFVGLSINLRDVVASHLLVRRAAEAIIALGTVLVGATLVLIPAQDRVLLSAELSAVAVVTFAVMLRLQRGVTVAAPGADQPGPPPGSLLLRRAVGLGTALLLAAAAITLALETGGGLYWWPAAVLAAYLSALTNAWVLLIEILR